MKRTAVAIFVALVVALAALTIRTTVSPDAIRSDVEHALSLWVDRPLAIAGTGEVHLLPLPGVRWTGVTVTALEDGTTLGRVDEVDVSLSPVDLVLGRAERATVTLRRPELRLPHIVDRPAMADLARRLTRIVPLRLSIVGGRLTPADGGETDAIEALDADLAWADTEARLSVVATFRWHGAPATVTLKGLSPAELQRGETTRIYAEAEAPGMAATFKGNVALDGARRLDGTLALALADSKAFAQWIGRPVVAELVAGRLEVEGAVQSTDAAAALAISRATFGTTRTKGVLSLRWDTPEPLAGGTLAFDTVDIRDGRAAVLGPGWAAVALDRDRLPLALDLRLSAGRVLTRTITLEKVAASLHLAERQLNAEIGEATLWNRPLSLMLRGDFDDDGLRATMKGSVHDLPVTEIATLFGVDGFEAGTAGAAFEGETRCARLGACLGALDGHLHLDARDLTVVGLSPFGDVSRFHPIALAARSITRKTEWQRADLDLRILGQKATVNAIEVIGDVAHFALSGTGDLATGSVDLAGNATFPNFRLDPTRNGSGTITMPIRIGGSVRHLEVSPGAPTAVAPAQPAPATEAAPTQVPPAAE